MNITFETERDDDGRWLAEVPELEGVMAYGATETEAIAKADALAKDVMAACGRRVVSFPATH
jgi:predicted RNase H-like HicB family nuclease